MDNADHQSKILDQTVMKSLESAAKVFAAQNTINTIRNELDGTDQSLGLIDSLSQANQELDSLRAKVKAAEQSVTFLSNRCSDAKTRLADAEGELDTHIKNHRLVIEGGFAVAGLAPRGPLDFGPPPSPPSWGTIKPTFGIKAA